MSAWGWIGLGLSALGAIGGVILIYDVYRNRTARRRGLHYLGFKRNDDILIIPAFRSLAENSSVATNGGLGINTTDFSTHSRPTPPPDPDDAKWRSRDEVVSIGESMAIQAIASYLTRIRHTGRLTVSPKWDATDFPSIVVLLGGPKYNRWTKQVLRQFEGFSIDEPRSVIQVSILPDLAPVPDDRDRGLFLTGPNPFAPNSRFILLAGTTTFGTGAIARHLFNHDLYRLTVIGSAVLWTRWWALNLTQKYFLLRRRIAVRPLGLSGTPGKPETYGQELERLVRYKRRRRVRFWGVVSDVSVGMLGYGDVDEASVTPFEYSRDLVPSYRFDQLMCDGTEHDVNRPVLLSGMSPRQIVECELVVRNVGSGTWTSDGNPLRDARTCYRLGTALARDHNGLFYTEGDWIENHRVAELADDLPPNGTTTVRFKLTAPSTPGRHHEDFQIVHELRTWCWGPYLTVVMDVTLPDGGGPTLSDDPATAQTAATSSGVQ